jgi:HEPN domain-containing protein
VPPPSTAPGTPKDWLVRAQAKLALSRTPLPAGAMWEDLCFWTQQAAELAMNSLNRGNEEARQRKTSLTLSGGSPYNSEKWKERSHDARRT